MSPDPGTTRAVAAWWVAFYLTSMGPLYRETLRRLGHGAAVDAVLAANPTPGGVEVPADAEVLLDELTVRGDAATARATLDRWYAAGAQTPVLALPPLRPVAELDHVLESLRPSGGPNRPDLAAPRPVEQTDLPAQLAHEILTHSPAAATVVSKLGGKDPCVRNRA
jgi:hypothetical protein